MGIMNKLADALARLKANEDILDKVVNGSVGAFINIGGTLVPSLASVMHRLAEYPPTGAWSTGVAYALKDLVTQGGLVYACTVAHMAGTFAADLAAGKWAIHQGLTAEDLANDEDPLQGSALVGHRGRTLRERLDDAVSVRDFGAKGDGTTDDTAAVQAAFSASRAPYFPGGRYRVTAPVTVTGQYSATGDGQGLCVRGDGDESILLHDFDGPLFVCLDGQPMYHSWSDLKILSTSPKTAGAVAFQYTGGLARSRFCNIRLGHNGTANAPAGFFNSNQDAYTDTVLFDHVSCEEVSGQCYGIGKGSSVWFRGGRITGASRDTATGITLYGGNGGVFLSHIDIIGLNRGFLSSAANGESNRELFFSQVAVDSCDYGLVFADSSYVSCEGLWAASCADSNVWLQSTYAGQFMMSAGTIFNGAGGRAAVNEWGGDGVRVEGASLLQISGVLIRDNKGAGINITGSVSSGIISDCLVWNNGVGVHAGGNVLVAGNRFAGGNGVNLNESGSGLWIDGNVGVNPGGVMSSPSLPASGAQYTYTGNWPVTVYVRAGTVYGTLLNGVVVYEGTNFSLRLAKGDKFIINYNPALFPLWQWVRN